MESLEFPIGTSPEDAHAFDLPGEKGKREELGISDEEVAQFFAEAFQVADRIREPRVYVWDNAWNLYNGVYDWSGKADWQSKNNIPKVRGMVDKAAETFRRALVRMKRFYSIESETKLGVEQGFYTMSLLDYWYDQIEFINAFTEGLKNGLITSTIVFKVWWDWQTDYEPRWETKWKKEKIEELGIVIGTREVPVRKLTTEARVRGKLGIKAISSYNMWVGPRDSYRIERFTTDAGFLDKMATQGYYNREAVDRVLGVGAPGADHSEESRRAQRANEGQRNPAGKYIREVDGYHYWGPIYDQEGKVLHPNATFTIAGDKQTVLRSAVKNPFFHGKDPYVIGTPYTVPFSTYNRGIVEDVAGIANMITELSNLIVDGAQFDAIPVAEGDTDLMATPHQVKNGLFPGMLIQTKGFENQHGKNVVRPVTLGRIPQLALQTIAFLDRESQLATSVINALRGQDIGTDTLGEFQGVVGGASGSLDDAARTVEETCINQMLDKSAKLIYQYHEDFTMARLAENFPQTSLAMSEMTPEERYATMIGGFAFRARGVSIFLDKGADLQKVMRFIELIANIPGILQQINIPEMLEQVIIAMGWNPQKILVNPASQPVVPAAMLGGQPVPVGPNGMPQASGNPGGLTPNQITNGQKGAAMGGSRNNPQANPNTGGQGQG